ncbi:hypothetical protein VB773_20795 [Haloarculaceae archaeon H-GB2-1]|nr:hypothetical protein [Haloarculaceae archaeon H-GB11]MEA5409770.1 hypothetical protein [Haloarculaceae archaeon H-GB2-1]
MRLVQVLIPEGTRSAVLDALDDQGIDYAVFDEVGRGDFEAMVQFPVPPSGVEPVMDELIEAGIRGMRTLSSSRPKPSSRSVCPHSSNGSPASGSRARSCPHGPKISRRRTPPSSRSSS